MRYLLVLICLLSLSVLADDDRRSDDIDIDVSGGDVTVPVDVDVDGGSTDLSIDGDSALALAAPGLGDVDIAQCLGSEAWTLLVGGKQKLVLNWVCMAEFYLENEKYELAAQALCNQPEILSEYDSEKDCEHDHDFTPDVVLEPQIAQLSRREEHNQDIERVLMAQSQLEQQIIELNDKLEEANRRPVSTSAPRIVQAEPAFTEEQKQAAWSALFDKGAEEDE